MKYNFTGAFQNYMDIDQFTLKWMVHDLDPPFQMIGIRSLMIGG